MTLEHYIPVIEDLSRELPTQTRYQRLLQAIHLAIPCDAICLLRRYDNQLHPVAFLGLKDEVHGRRFLIENHPRLHAIINSSELVRFQADSVLPDPYDGLMNEPASETSVHDCMGVSIYIEGQPWGVITFDAADPGQFDQVNSHQQALAIMMTRAVITAVERIDQLCQQLSHEHNVTAGINRELASYEIIGTSLAIQKLMADIDIVAQTNLTVLVNGETGVGKELVAQQLHLKSDRKNQPLIKLNCAALPENLAEAELFGHTRGAFTGADDARAGRFEIADGGTLLLDEVGELPLSLQAKLLRVLQEGEVQRMGSDTPIKVDVRIIAATNRNLVDEVKKGSFRADLYHRLSVFPLVVPALRDRAQDVLLLAEFFLERNQYRLNINKLLLTDDARQMLLSYSWPGNVRELEHLLSRAALKASQEKSVSNFVYISAKHLDIGTIEPEPLLLKNIEAEKQDISNFDSELSLVEGTKNYQRQLIEQALVSQQGNIAAAARQLQVDRSNLARLIKRLGVRK